MHIVFGTSLSVIFGINVMNDAEKRPNVARWFAEISSRLTWKETKKEWFAYMGRPLPADSE